MSKPGETAINQCDGCRQGLPLGTDWMTKTMHMKPDGSPYMCCTKKEYEDETNELGHKKH